MTRSSSKHPLLLTMAGSRFRWLSWRGLGGGIASPVEVRAGAGASWEGMLRGAEATSAMASYVGATEGDAIE